MLSTRLLKQSMRRSQRLRRNSRTHSRILRMLLKAKEKEKKPRKAKVMMEKNLSQYAQMRSMPAKLLTSLRTRQLVLTAARIGAILLALSGRTSRTYPKSVQLTPQSMKTYSGKAYGSTHSTVVMVNRLMLQSTSLCRSPPPILLKSLLKHRLMVPMPSPCRRAPY